MPEQLNTNPFSVFFGRLFKSTTEDGKQEVEDTFLYDGYIADSRYDRWSYEDKLLNYYRPEAGLAITDTLISQIDDLAANDPLIGMAFEKITTLTDTPFEIELELNGNKDAEEILRILDEELPRYFPGCSTIRDIRYLIISEIVLHGLFSCQIIPNEGGKGIRKIVLPPTDSIKWERYNNQWRLIQHFRGQIIPVESPDFIYQPLFVIRNKYGIWAIPLFKAALKPAYAYKIFSESIEQIARRTGMNKLLDMMFKSSDLVKQANPATPQGRATLNSWNKRMQGFVDTIRATLPNGIVGHPEDVEMKELTTFEPSQTLQTFHDLLANRVITGCKLYPSILGIQGRENQTTLSSNQKQAVKSLITTISDKTNIALKSIIERYLAWNNIAYKQVEIESEEPKLETNLEDQQAREVELRNERAEIEIENLKNNPGETMDSEGNVQKKNKAELENQKIEKEDNGED